MAQSKLTDEQILQIARGITYQNIGGREVAFHNPYGVPTRFPSQQSQQPAPQVPQQRTPMPTPNPYAEYPRIAGETVAGTARDAAAYGTMPLAYGAAGFFDALDIAYRKASKMYFGDERSIYDYPDYRMVDAVRNDYRKLGY